jgi:hypothetical protein
MNRVELSGKRQDTKIAREEAMSPLVVLAALDYRSPSNVLTARIASVKSGLDRDHSAIEGAN